MTNEELKRFKELIDYVKASNIVGDADGKVISAVVESETSKQVAEIKAEGDKQVALIESERAKKDRICQYVTTGLQALVHVGTAACSVLIFAAGLNFEQTGTYTSPFTKSMAQNAMRKF